MTRDDRSIPHHGPRARSRPRGFVLLVTLLAVLPAPDHSLAAPWPAGADDDASSLDADEPGADLRETMEIYMLAKMKRSLELSQEQEERLVPVIQDLSAARQRFRQERRLALTRLGPLADDPATGESTLRAELERLQEAEKAFRGEEGRHMDQIREILSTRQEAQFVVFIEQFMHDMQRRLRQMKQLHGDPGRGAPLPGAGPRRRARPPGGI